MCLSCFSLPFPFIIFSISLIALILATETDLRKRIVPNKLSYGIILLGLGLYAGMSFIQNDSSFFANSAIAAVYAFLLALGLYKAGVWAGGDVKLFTGLAALNPVNVNLLQLLGVKIALFETVMLPLFPISLFVFSIFCMFPYGAVLGIKRLKERKGFGKEVKGKLLGVVFFSAFITGIYSLLNVFEINFLAVFLLVLVGIFLFGVLESRNKLLGRIVAIALLVFALWENSFGALGEFVYLFLFLFAAFILIKLFFASRELFKKEMKISELQEGMIVGESIFWEKGKVKRAEALSIGKVINYLKHNKLEELKKLIAGKKNEIVGVRKARGVTEEEIEKLQKLVKEGKLEDRILVKESAPMVPAMLLAYIVLNIVGDLFWNLIFL